ncbi:MAG: ParB/RepB/Spo0J family partition protein [Acidiferrobacteraceae bacterium]
MRIEMPGCHGEVLVAQIADIAVEGVLPIDKSLEENLRALPLLQFPVVVRGPEGGYDLVSGRRRIRAFQDLGRISIPVFVIEPEHREAVAHAILAENLVRRPNLLVELPALEALVAGGKSLEEIRATLGLYQRDFQRLSDLLSLDPAAIAALQEGEISVSTARVLAKLSPAHQQEFLARDERHTLARARDWRMKVIFNSDQMTLDFLSTPMACGL